MRDILRWALGWKSSPAGAAPTVADAYVDYVVVTGPAHFVIATTPCHYAPQTTPCHYEGKEL